MKVALDSRIETTNGTFMISDFLTQDDLKNFPMNVEKRIYKNVKVIDKNYKNVAPISVKRLGKGSCVKISTYNGYECMVPSTHMVSTDINSTVVSANLKIGDSILLSGNYSDTDLVVPIVVSEELDPKGFLSIDDTIGELLGLVYVYGTSTGSMISTAKFPTELISDSLRYFLDGKATVLSVVSGSRNVSMIRITNKHLINVISTAGVLVKDKFPEFLWKSKRSVGYSFIKSLLKDKLSFGSIHSIHTGFMKDFHNYLFLKFGIIAKWDNKMMFHENFSEILKNIVAEKQTMRDINPHMENSLVTENSVQFYLKDRISHIEVVEREIFDITFSEKESEVSIGNIL